MQTTPACRRCASPLAFEEADCPHCRGRGIRPYRQVVALGPFRQPLRPIIHQLKYHHRWTLAEIMGDRLAGLPRVRAVLLQADCIMAVPLHWTRQIHRGYNQSESLAMQLIRSVRTDRKLQWVQPVKRVRRTPMQALTHSRQKRKANLRGAFALTRPDQVQGRNVVVVDDVMTTAATLRELGRALQQAQPASLHGIVLAVADPKHHDFSAV